MQSPSDLGTYCIESIHVFETIDFNIHVENTWCEGELIATEVKGKGEAVVHGMVEGNPLRK